MLQGTAVPQLRDSNRRVTWPRLPPPREWVVRLPGMIAPRYRKAAKNDVLDPSRGPSELGSRFLTSFLFLGCGGFALVYVFTKSFIAAGVVSGGLFALSAHSILGHHRDIKRRESRLGEAEAIEVVEIRASRVFEVEAPGSTGPALCFELPDGQVLLLYGQWLLEHTLYRAPRPVDDGNQERFNLADDPYGFPSDHFLLHRWRGEVKPFWIEICGKYLAPEDSAVQLPKRTKIRQVEVFAGTFSSLQRDINCTFEREVRA